MRVSRLTAIMVAAGVVFSLLGVALSGVVLTAAAATGGAGAPHAASSRLQTAATSFSITGDLLGVAAVSANDAWAVGYSGNPHDVIVQTLILHWNGKSWSRVTSPKPVDGALDTVTAVSPDDVWAGGVTGDVYEVTTGTLIMHWNGKTWSRQTNVPTPRDGYLTDMASSGNSVWAVGAVTESVKGPPAILHRTGGSWYVVPSPAPVNTVLSCIAATGGNTAWAAGYHPTLTGDYLMRWNGSVWKTVSFPLHSAHDELAGMAAGPGGSVWAVGGSWSNSAGTKGTPVSMLWNGKAWRKVPVPVLVPHEADSYLLRVASVPGGTAWAVGSTGSTAVVMRWTGTAWTQVIIPSDNGLIAGVAATSAGNAWAVGGIYSGPILIMHWNGKTWSNWP